jgi:hypothetical protein
MTSEVEEHYGGRSEINRLVIEACADDYEEFSMIVSEIEKWTKGGPTAPTTGQIEEALVQSIANKDIEAFEVHGCELHLTTVQPDHETISDLWFYVTEQGKNWIREMCEIESNEVSSRGLAQAPILRPAGDWLKKADLK